MECGLIVIIVLLNRELMELLSRIALMELTYFYKAEMPNYQDWILDVSKLNILLIWDRTIQTTIKMNLNNPVPIH